jgi:hypothetical protein
VADVLVLLSASAHHPQVAKVVFNVSFFDSSNAQQGVARDDFVLLECGTTQLPATLAQGEEVVW